MGVLSGLDAPELGQLPDPVLDELLLVDGDAELLDVHWVAGGEVDAVLKVRGVAQVVVAQAEHVRELQQERGVRVRELRRAVDLELGQKVTAALLQLLLGQLGLSWRILRRLDRADGLHDGVLVELGGLRGRDGDERGQN